ncbi:MAG: T9SS type A sorting domain-containing protein [Bacteroidota bacterium]
MRTASNALKVFRLLPLIFLISSTQAQEMANAVHGTDQDSCDILFLGSSHFNFSDLPNLFKEMAAHSGKEISVDQYLRGGFSLSDHAGSSDTEAIIKERDWDYVVLQGSGSIAGYPELFPNERLYPALYDLQNMIEKNCESTIMIYCLPWAYEDGMKWNGMADTYADMQVKIYNNTLQYSNILGFLIAPVGWAWYAVLEELNYPRHYLHLSDWSHPSMKGSYLMACVLYSTIYQESTVGNTFYAVLTEDEATYFQTISATTVLDSLELWNLTEITDIGENLITHSFSLHQNYPNPFRSVTRIEYETEQNTFVEIALFDMLGKRCVNLVNGYKMPGKHSLRFHGTNLKSGVYYYRMIIDGQQQVRKMLLTK